MDSSVHDEPTLWKGTIFYGRVTATLLNLHGNGNSKRRSKIGDENLGLVSLGDFESSLWGGAHTIFIFKIGHTGAFRLKYAGIGWKP